MRRHVSSKIAVTRELLISCLLAQSNAVASAVGLTPALAPAPAPDDAAAPPSLQAPRSVYLQTPATPGKCSFDNYRPFYLNPEKQLEFSATLQSLADNAEVQILSLTLTDKRDGPHLASVRGADKLVNTLQTLCEMQCVADRGDEYRSPIATFHSNDYSKSLQVKFYGHVSGPTFECITKNTDLIQDTPKTR